MQKASTFFIVLSMLITGAIVVTPRGIFHDSINIHPRTGKIIPSINRQNSSPILDASGLYLYPGLINAHDHLELNHYPRTKFRSVYTNARQWAEEMTRTLKNEPFISLQKYALWEKCLSGGLKNLFSGVTTVAHHNPLHRPLKANWFPVHVVHNYSWSHSLYLSTSTEIQKAYRQRNIWMIHLAEGTDDAAEQEFFRLEELGCVSPKTLLIHGVSIHDKSATEKCGGLIWCPSTNQFLLGKTADIAQWYESEKLALGSDSRLTADGDLLNELKAAAGTGQLSGEALFHTVTDFPAKILQLSDRGDLRPGMQADMLALPQTLHSDPYQALLNARRSDIVWVMRGGKVLWKQDRQTPNCLLDGVPYCLDTRILKKVQQSQLTETGLSILTKI